MYLDYYSLERPPFRITPDPALFFTGGVHGRGVVLEALLYAIQSGEGILKVVGEVGSGKTMLCRMLEQRLPDTVEVVYLANPKLTPHDILYAVAFELKLDVDQTTPRLILMQKMQSYLLDQHSANRSVLVIIEEAQSMPLETLEEIRLFSNLETHQHKLMQIILFGQPELDKNLQDKNIRQLRERITHSFYLSPLTTDEVGDYLRHRLQAAGCPAPQVFSKSAEKLIAKASGGLTRRINILADKAMLAAYSESATSTRPRSLGNQLEPTVQARHVKAAIQDSDYKPSIKLSAWTIALAILLALMSLLVVMLAADRFRLTNGETVTNIQQFADEPSGLNANEVAPSEMLALETAEAVVSAPVISEPLVVESVVVEPVVVEPVVSAPVIIEPVVVEPVLADVAVEQVATDSVAVSPELQQPLEPAAAQPDEVLAQAAEQSPTLEPAAAAAPVAAPGFDSVPSIIQQRRLAFDDWTKSGQTDSYTLQVLFLGSEDIPYLESVLNNMDRSGLLAQTFACLTMTQNGYIWRILYGLFPNLEAARSNVRALPADLQSNQPFAQNLDRIECISPGEEQ